MTGFQIKSEWTIEPEARGFLEGGKGDFIPRNSRSICTI
jgi:hypothetical protein